MSQPPNGLYSVQELCERLDKSPIEIRGALRAIGAHLTYEGMTANLSNWRGAAQQLDDGSVFITMDGDSYIPPPERVFVHENELPENWARLLGFRKPRRRSIKSGAESRLDSATRREQANTLRIIAALAALAKLSPRELAELRVAEIPDAAVCSIAHDSELAIAPRNQRAPSEPHPWAALYTVLNHLMLAAKMPSKGAAAVIEFQLNHLGLDSPKEKAIRNQLNKAKDYRKR